MGDEGSCGRAAGDGVQYGSLDLHVASALEEGAHEAHKLRAYLKIAARLVAHDEVNVALTVLELGARHAVELLGQGTETLGEQNDALRVDGYLLGLGLEDIARNAYDIADVVPSEVVKLLLGEYILADIELDLTAVILYVAEYRLAHAALGHDASRDLNGLAVEGIVVGLYLGGVGAS